MFDFVHENQRAVQIILLLLILPFALWGIDSYRRSSTAADVVAKVDGEKITQQEFDNAMHNEEQRLRQMFRGNIDPAMLESAEVKRSVLDKLVSQHLLVIKAREAGLGISDEQLIQIISQEQAFQKDGKFDLQQYETVLRAQGMSTKLFESRVRDELQQRVLMEGYLANGYGSDAVADRLIRLNEQQRVVSVAQLAPDAFLKQAKVSDADVKAYYDKNQQQFRTAEAARVEYVTLSPEDLMSQISVSEDDVKKAYEEHKSEMGAPAEVHAAHILIALPPKATDADRQAARAKAEEVLKEVRAAPGKFAELAKKYSADPGSAANGGDLGSFGRGAMVKPFEDAVFSMKAGEISGVVQSDFGFHIIKLLELKPAKTPAFAEVKNTLTQQLKLQKATDKFNELAEKFSNAAYEQSDSLKPAAEVAHLTIRQSGWLERGKPAGTPWTDKALQEVFSDDVLNKKRNSKAIEIGPNTLMAVRLIEHKPAAERPLAEVSDMIRKQLQREQAGELAAKEGQALLTKLQKGEKVNVSWKASQTVTRLKSDGVAPELARQIVQADASKLPAYVGVESAQGGYALARIEAVKDVGAIDDAKRAAYVRKIREMTGEALFMDFLDDAKKNAGITMKSFGTAEK